jgi:hypothetical protein
MIINEYPIYCITPFSVFQCQTFRACVNFLKISQIHLSVNNPRPFVLLSFIWLALTNSRLISLTLYSVFPRNEKPRGRSRRRKNGTRNDKFRARKAFSLKHPSVPFRSGREDREAEGGAAGRRASKGAPQIFPRARAEPIFLRRERRPTRKSPSGFLKRRLGAGT